jgi:hypothetical protein
MPVQLAKAKRAHAMPDQHDFDQRNDQRFLTPLLLMVIIVVGSLIYGFVAHAAVAG